MSKHLERDLENLQESLLRLASSVEEAIYKAARALQHRDIALAQQVASRSPFLLATLRKFIETLAAPARGKDKLSAELGRLAIGTVRL